MIDEIFNFINMGGHSFYVWTAYLIPLTLIFSFVMIQRKKLSSIKNYDS